MTQHDIVDTSPVEEHFLGWHDTSDDRRCAVYGWLSWCWCSLQDERGTYTLEALRRMRDGQYSERALIVAHDMAFSVGQDDESGLDRDAAYEPALQWLRENAQAIVEIIEADLDR